MRAVRKKKEMVQPYPCRMLVRQYASSRFSNSLPLVGVLVLASPASTGAELSSKANKLDLVAQLLGSYSDISTTNDKAA